MDACRPREGAPQRPMGRGVRDSNLRLWGPDIRVPQAGVGPSLPTLGWKTKAQKGRGHPARARLLQASGREGGSGAGDRRPPRAPCGAGRSGEVRVQAVLTPSAFPGSPSSFLSCLLWLPGAVGVGCWGGLGSVPQPPRSPKAARGPRENAGLRRCCAFQLVCACLAKFLTWLWTGSP